MVEEVFRTRLLGLIQRMIDGGTKDLIPDSLKFKRDLTQEIVKIGLMVNQLDANIAVLSPDPDWQNGYLFDQVGPVDGQKPAPTAEVTTPVRTYDRKTRALGVARKFAEEGGRGSVTTAEVAAYLRQEGDEATTKGLSIAVGNILQRSGLWTKIGAGKYQFTGRM